MTERMTEILEAACRVIARGGVAALRIADVAAEAGVSTALVHYYFATRDDLLTRVFAFVDERADERATAALRPLATGLARVERLLRVYLDDERVFRDSWLVWMEMQRTAVFEPHLREAVLDSQRAWVAQIAQHVDEGRADGSIPERVRAAEAAHRLAATLDGLGQQVVLGGLERERAARLVRDAIALELGVTLTGEEAAA
jgi:AcrR family transcriptional regulator